MPYRFAATVTPAQKTALTQDFAAATGWTPASPTLAADTAGLEEP